MLVTISNPRCMLDLLAPEYAVLPNGFHLREGRDVAKCKQYLVDPASLSDSVVDDLVIDLRSRNIQAIAAQLIARRLRWWSGLQVAAYISLADTRVGVLAFEAMVADGIPIDKLYLQLLEKFTRYVCECLRRNCY